MRESNSLHQCDLALPTFGAGELGGVAMAPTSFTSPSAFGKPFHRGALPSQMPLLLANTQDALDHICILRELNQPPSRGDYSKRAARRNRVKRRTRICIDRVWHRWQTPLPPLASRNLESSR